MKYKIGDRVWFAATGTTTKLVTCPDCAGSGRLRVILGDETEVGVDCCCCDPGGFRGSRGVIEYCYHTPRAETSFIEKIGMSAKGVHYTGDRFYEKSEEHLFETQAEAEAAAAVLAAEYTAEAIRRAHAKEKDARTWAWHVKYHRRELVEAERRAAHHREKLAISVFRSRVEKPSAPRVDAKNEVL